MDRRTQRSMIALVVGVSFGATLALVADGQPDRPDQPATSPVETVRAAGDATGLWIASTSAAGQTRLLHRTADLPDDLLRPAIEESATLQGLAGGGTRSFVIYDDRTVQSIQRQVDPRRRTTEYSRAQYPPLPKAQSVIDAVSVGVRLSLLLDLGDASSSPGASGASGAGASESDASESAGDNGEQTGPGTGAATEPRSGRWLVQSAGSQWRWTPLPDALPTDAKLRLAAAGGSGASIVTKTDNGKTLVAARDDDGWTITQYPHAPAGGFQVLRAMRELILVEPAAAGAGLRATVLSEGQAKDAGRLDLPEAELAGWVATGYADRVSVVAAARNGKLWLAQRGLTQPPSAEPTLAELKVEAAPGPAFNEQLLFYGLLALAVLSVLAVRRMDRAEVAVELPQGLMPAPIGRRVVALAIDLAPSVAVMMWAFGEGDPVAVVMPWLALSSDLAALAPGASAIALTAAHGAVAELFIGGSIGKRLVGLRTVTVKGGRAGWRGIALRNGLKMIELLLWPLALFALLNEPHQRMGDLVGRTLVVTKIPLAESSESGEAGEQDTNAGTDEPDGDDGPDRSRGDT